MHTEQGAPRLSGIGLFNNLEVYGKNRYLLPQETLLATAPNPWANWLIGN